MKLVINRMDEKKRVLLKITGTIFLDTKQGLSAQRITPVITQIKKLHATHRFGIVIGGGNIFRGGNDSTSLGITINTGHQVGMLATMINGLFLHDLLSQEGLASTLFCATPSTAIGTAITPDTIAEAHAKDHVAIFAGGTGNPFFTTDTNAILRSLQWGSQEVWKGTNVDGVYNKDPQKHPDAQRLNALTHKQAIEQHLGIMDLTAYAMAAQHNQTVRVFNIFEIDALLHAAQNNQFGTYIS